MIGSIGTSAGLLLRVLINKSFWWVILGQTLCSVAQPFLYNAPALLTSKWFPEKERPLATMIGTMANVIGVLLGFILPSLTINPYSSTNTYNQA